jgi:hypothetical protein
MAETMGQCRPFLLALLLLRLVSLLGPELMLCYISCLAEQRCRHRRQSLKLTINAPTHPRHLEPSALLESEAEEVQRVRRHPVAAQPPSSTLGEPCHPTAVARVRV